jgi:hypothetical protein
LNSYSRTDTTAELLKLRASESGKFETVCLA